MKLKSEEFDRIIYNNKIIEVRLNDEKRKKINIGDRIIFHRIPDLRQFVSVRVEGIYTFLTFRELYEAFPFSYFGYNDFNINDILGRIYEIYSPIQEGKNGVVAIKFMVEDRNIP